MKLEHWDLGPLRRRTGIIRAVGILIIAIPLLGAAGTVGYRVRDWKGSGEAARCIATDAHAPEADRAKAVVGLRRDVDLTIAVLRQMAEEPGDVGRQARNALAYLKERMR